MAVFVFSILVLWALLALLVYAPPAPHNIDGRVFSNSTNGVPNGIPVLINDTSSGDIVLVETFAPPVPELMGIYSATIIGNDSDNITAIAWNDTSYGTNTTILASTTTDLNIVLNTSRPSEANVTIIIPLNNSLMNKSIPFNVTVNISMLGNNGINCNATISFSDPLVLNLSSGQNQTILLGDIAFHTFKVANWTVNGIKNGSSNISVRADCQSDGIKIENLNIKTADNITVQNLAPSITRLSITSPIDLAPASNITVLCNISVTDANSASDISGVNATFYLQSVGFSAPNDNNNHYTNQSCSIAGQSAFASNYSCGFAVSYYASNGTWVCNSTVSDYSNATDYANRTALINELMAIQVTPGIIDYGNLRVGNISAQDINVTLRNTGNIPINSTVRALSSTQGMGYLNLSMNCEKGNISNDDQRFSTLSGNSFLSMNPLNNISQAINFSLPQRTDDFAFGNDTNTTYWKLRIPPLTLGLCNGTIIFSAISISS
ncbi:MAG TPA: hypothetical protein VI564_00695 [Candidatus Nanoarchaeia archaeon]|nr:hypothetical protein [Candidatus Nanoarchaeia archaeon]